MTVTLSNCLANLSSYSRLYISFRQRKSFQTIKQSMWPERSDRISPFCSKHTLTFLFPSEIPMEKIKGSNTSPSQDDKKWFLLLCSISTGNQLHESVITIPTDHRSTSIQFNNNKSVLMSITIHPWLMTARAEIMGEFLLWEWKSVCMWGCLLYHFLRPK